LIDDRREKYTPGRAGWHPEAGHTDDMSALVDILAAGLWREDAQSASAPNCPVIRADPEREWGMVGTAAYWVDR
jgi:hypothetical protein